MRGTQTKTAGHPAAALPADRDRGPVHVQGQEIRTRKGAASARRASRGRQVAVEARYDYVKLIAQPARTRIWSPARLLRCLVKTERWGLGTPTPSAKRRSGSMIEFGHQPAPLCRSSIARLGCCLERCPLADGRVAHGAGGLSAQRAGEAAKRRPDAALDWGCRAIGGQDTPCGRGGRLGGRGRDG